MELLGKNAQYSNNTDILKTFGPYNSFALARRLHHDMFCVVLENPSNANVRPYVHAELIFIYSLTYNTAKFKLLERFIPWDKLVFYLNALISILFSPPAQRQIRVPSVKGVAQVSKVQSNAAPLRRVKLPSSLAEEPEIPNATGHVPYRPFVEDYTLRGLIWAESIYPDQYHENANLDIDERALSQPSDEEDRLVRILWVGRRICSRLTHRLTNPLTHLTYDYEKAAFSSLKVF